jgi:hypothetical protein
MYASKLQSSGSTVAVCEQDQVDGNYIYYNTATAATAALLSLQYITQYLLQKLDGYRLL